MPSLQRNQNLPLSLLLLALAGCGGDSGLDDGSDESGQVKVSVADAPVDGVSKVVVKLGGVELKVGDETYTIDRTPLQVDLLATAFGDPVALLTTPQIDSGEIEHLRLTVISSRGTLDSYVVVDGAQYPLYVPSGSEPGLKVNGNGLAVPPGGVRSLVVDFDLRKSLVKPEGQDAYYLKPVLRLVDQSAVGSIAGEVAPALLSGAGCTGDPNTLEGYSVYAYPGANATPDDTGGNVGDGPVASSLLALAEGNRIVYSIAYLPPGNYTVAFSCQTANDDPEADDPIVLVQPRNAVVTGGQSTQVPFL